MIIDVIRLMLDAMNIHFWILLADQKIAVLCNTNNQLPRGLYTEWASHDLKSQLITAAKNTQTILK